MFIIIKKEETFIAQNSSGLPYFSWSTFSEDFLVLTANYRLCSAKCIVYCDLSYVCGHAHRPVSLGDGVRTPSRIPGDGVKSRMISMGNSLYTSQRVMFFRNFSSGLHAEVMSPRIGVLRFMFNKKQRRLLTVNKRAVPCCKTAQLLIAQSKSN